MNIHEEILSVETAPGVTISAQIGCSEFADTSRILTIFPPHPSLGGNMDNNVVHSLYLQGIKENVVSVKFEYRGVASGRVGKENLLSYWESLEEKADFGVIVDDSVKLLTHVKNSFNKNATLYFTAYSFGNYIALLAAPGLNVTNVCGISPPAGEYDFLRELDKTSASFFVALNDVFCLQQDICKLRNHPSVTVTVLDAEDHFFRDEEKALAGSVVSDALKRN